MRIIYLSLLLLTIACSAYADAFDDHFAIVFIDEDTESKYGDVPLDREIIAKAIVKIAGAGAKGIVLKFFLDRVKDDE